MLPLYTLLNFLVRLAGLTTALWWLSSKFLAAHLPNLLAHHLVLASLALAWFVLYIDGNYIYPLLRSPLRKLPAVYIPVGRDMTLVTEMPRGSTPLQWVTENPNADLLRMRGNRFVSEAVIPVSPAALRDLMSTNTYDFVKPSGLRNFLAGVIGWGLITTEGNVHKRLRKALIPAFNVKHIRALYPTMWEQTGILLREMGKTCDMEGSVEISDWASRLALDIIGRSALSRDFQSLSTEEHPVAKAFASILEPEPHMVIFLGLNLGLPVGLTRLFPLKANKTVKDVSRYLRGFCTDLLHDQQRILAIRNLDSIKKAEDANDHSILRNIVESGEFTDDEVIDQMLTFIAAGHETTGSSISWAMHLLTLPEFKHYQALVRNEIRSAFPAKLTSQSTSESESESEFEYKCSFSTNDTPQWNEFESLPYLNGLCEEILRLFPAVPTTLRESIRKTSLAGNIIPADTMVLVVPWAINRNPNYWGPEADKLRPERWIDTTPDGSMRANKHGGAVSNYCEITFLHGQRACIGRDFAKAELRCVLAGILGRFEVSRLKGDNGQVEITGAVTTKPRGGLKVNLTTVPGW